MRPPEESTWRVLVLTVRIRHIGVSNLRSVCRRRQATGLAGCPLKTGRVNHARTQVDVVPTEGTGEGDSRDSPPGQMALVRAYATRRTGGDVQRPTKWRC